MGIAGWKSIIPIYNYICFCKVAMGKKKYAWLLLIPYVNIIFILILFCNLAKVFGKDTGMQVLTALLPGFMIPLMAFDDSSYVKPVSTNIENNATNVIKNNIEEEKEKESNIFVKIICWIITIFMLLMLYGCILVAVEDKEYSYYIYSLFVLVFTIMACPLISYYTRKFKKYTKYKKYIVILLIIIFLILLCVL